MAKILQVAEGNRYYAPMFVAAMSGLRRGELLALTWRHVNLDAGRIEVVATLQRVGNELSLSEPKTHGSRRGVRLPRSAVQLLRRHRREQAQRRLLAGEAWKDDDLVFDNGIGGFIEPSELSRAVHRAARQAGVADFRLHDMRHGYATALLSQGVHPKVVSETLGHSKIAITLDIYSHVLPTMGDAAADAVERAYRGLL